METLLAIYFLGALVSFFLLDRFAPLAITPREQMICAAKFAIVWPFVIVWTIFCIWREG